LSSKNKHSQPPRYNRSLPHIKAEKWSSLNF
jgi:hypothetical protein